MELKRQLLLPKIAQTLYTTAVKFWSISPVPVMDFYYRHSVEKIPSIDIRKPGSWPHADFTPDKLEECMEVRSGEMWKRKAEAQHTTCRSTIKNKLESK